MTVLAPAVTVERVSYRYPRGGSEVLRDISLKVRRGEILAVMGKTGAGKTTLLSLFNGLIPHFYEGELSGTVVASALDTRQYHIHTLASRVGFVLQDTETQILGTTVESDTAFGPCNLGLPADRVLDAVRRSLAAVGLTGLEKRESVHLSGGEKQRLAVAGTIAMDPGVLVLDEPTSELDPEGRRELFAFLRRLRDEGKYTIVLSTHDSDEVAEFVDRVAVLGDGRLLWLGEPRELFGDSQRCREFGIKPPAAAEIFWHLNDRKLATDGPLPMTVSEAAGRLAGLVSKAHTSSPAPPQRSFADRKRAIEVENLHFRYDGERDALNGINLVLRQGEFVALVGTNGAGKSTLVKHFNGLLKPSSGRVLVNGLDTRSTPTQELSRVVGYVFQNPDHQIFCPTVREEIEFGLRQGKGLGESEIADRVRRAMEVVGLEGMESRHPFTLGKGERQKLAVASILAVEPDVLVIDEPTTGLDREGAERMMDLIRALHREGHLILVITHDLQLAAECADRIIVLRGGAVLADGSPAEVFLNDELIRNAGLGVPPIAGLSLALRSHGFSANAVTMNALIDSLDSITERTPA